MDRDQLLNRFAAGERDFSGANLHQALSRASLNSVDLTRQI